MQPLTTISNLDEIMAEARAAAREALISAIPTPVTWASNISPELYTVNEGVCGFAWVKLIGLDGRTKLGKQLIAAGARSDYYGGYQFRASYFVPEYNGQSYERKLAACEAAAKVLESHGIQCLASGRLD